MSIRKCKAHRSREECERGEPHELYVWHGNDAADRAAKEAAITAASSRTDVLAYESEFSRAAEVARTFGRMLAPLRGSSTQAGLLASGMRASLMMATAAAGISGAHASPVGVGNATFVCALRGSPLFGAGGAW